MVSMVLNCGVERRPDALNGKDPNFIQSKLHECSHCFMQAYQIHIKIATIRVLCSERKHTPMVLVSVRNRVETQKNDLTRNAA